jgi:hypothetical protein
LLKSFSTGVSAIARLLRPKPALSAQEQRRLSRGRIAPLQLGEEIIRIHALLLIGNLPEVFRFGKPAAHENASIEPGDSAMKARTAD